MLDMTRFGWLCHLSAFSLRKRKYTNLYNHVDLYTKVNFLSFLVFEFGLFMRISGGEFSMDPTCSFLFLSKVQVSLLSKMSPFWAKLYRFAN